MDNNNIDIEKIDKVPVLPLLQRPLFPQTFTTLMVGRPEDVLVMNNIIQSNGYFVALLQGEGPNPGLSSVGTLAKVSKYIRLPNNCLHVFISTLQRVRVDDFYVEQNSIEAKIEDFPDDTTKTKTVTPYANVLKETVQALSQSTTMFNFAADLNIMNIDDPGLLSFYVASALNVANAKFLQDVLETSNARVRIEKLLSYISAQKEIYDRENAIKNQFFDNIKNKNKETILKEQIRNLQNELDQITGSAHPMMSNGSKVQRKQDLFARAKQKKLPAEFRDVVDQELEKLSGLEMMNPEYMLTKLYIETILALPFSFEDKAPSYSILKVKKQLEKDHYGMKEVKERILEFLASRRKANTTKGAIICLAGPPGVGKTSVGKSIAKALDRKFYRFSVGGMRDEAEIKGHRRTYVGALPGKIIQGMKTTGVVDPVFLIDEIDKMGESFRGDPASALLEVLDPEQNANYVDLYLDIPYDLSRVLFIVTANDISKIPAPLLDRMEIIELSGYTPEEKIHIGQKYLVPKHLEKNGLTKKEVHFDKDALGMIAEEYAREAGVRNFENLIDKVMRKIALSILEEGEDATQAVTVKAKDVEKYLGKPPFPSDDIVKADVAGTAIGLAWTSMGGDVLLIESEALPFKGDLKVTGQLGDVMKESVSIAWSTLKKEAWLRGLDLDFFDNYTVHIHIPEGATPKDGPSAGITLFTSLWSMYRKMVIKPNLAMTGELTLTGKVMPIGGLKEKILAARRDGIKEIIIPERNKIDLDKLDNEVKGDVVFYPVSNISQVIEIAFPEEKTKHLDEDMLNKLANERRKKAEEEKDAENLSRAKALEKVLNWQ